MSQSKNRLQSLIELAKEPSSEKRRQLLREITDVFVEAPMTFSRSDSNQIGEILGKVAMEVEMTVRQKLAERLATIPEAPHGLIRQLANDQIEVARPVLLKSGVLDDHDLIAIIKLKGQDHIGAVAQRETISSAVTDQIVEHGDDASLLYLVKNDGAEISRPTFERIIDKAEDNEKLHEPVLHRNDLPLDLMNEMYFYVSAALREFIAKSTSDLDQKQIEKLVAESAEGLAQDIARAQAELSEAEQYVRDVAKRKQLTEAFIVDLLRKSRMSEFVAGFAMLTEVDDRTARRIMTDKSGEALAIACRACGFSRSSFSTIVMTLDKNSSKTISETKVLLAAYNQIPIETAKRTMRFWRIRQSAIGQKQAAA
jgi:uncharacterized protein (DUF2336 family)